MRLDVDARVATAAHVAAMRESVEKHEARATGGLERIIRRYVREAMERFLYGHLAVTAAAPPDLPSWRIPLPVDLLDEPSMQAELDARAKALADAAATTTAHSVAAALGIEFDQRNRLLDGVIKSQSGSRIVTAPEDLVRTMMTSLQKSHDAGDSIPRAARAMRTAGYTHGRSYAERIARTELIGAVNAASLAQVQGATTIPYKLWMATNDNRTRPHHREADGQTVPIDSTFSVGGFRLEYPGDPNGPGEEVILCRCTMGYTDEPRGLATIAGGGMATTDTTTDDAAVGGSWSGVVAQEGVDTGDGRRIAEGALNWRELPLTLMAQHTTPDFGGHAEAEVAGRIDTLTRSGADILGTGIFDTGEWGSETERMVREGMLKGVSIDLAINDAEILPAEGIDDEIEALFMGTLNVLDGTILGATIVPFPAFENANIAIVAGAAMRLGRFRSEILNHYPTEDKATRVTIASFYMPFAPFPVGGDDEADPADANSDAAEAIADITDAVNGWPGLDGQVVITIDGKDTTVDFPPAKADGSEPGETAITPEVQAALARLVQTITRKAP